MAQRVIVPDLPQHARIGSGRGHNGNAANHREYRNGVQDVRGDDELLHLPWRRRDKERVGLTLHLCWVPQYLLMFNADCLPWPAAETAALLHGVHGARTDPKRWDILNSVGIRVNPVFCWPWVRWGKAASWTDGQVKCFSRYTRRHFEPKVTTSIYA